MDGSIACIGQHRMIPANASPACIVQGSIQLGVDPQWSTRIGLSSSPARRDNDRWQVTGPGLTVSWSVKSASHAASTNALCVVWGTPRARLPDSKLVAAPTTAEHIMKRLLAIGLAALSEIRGSFGVFFVDASAKR